MFDNGCFLRRQRRFRCPRKEALRNAAKQQATVSATSTPTAPAVPPCRQAAAAAAAGPTQKFIPVDRLKSRDCRRFPLPVGYDAAGIAGTPRSTFEPEVTSYARPGVFGRSPVSSHCACASAVLDHVTGCGCCHRRRSAFSISRIIADNSATSSMFCHAPPTNFRFADRIPRTTAEESCQSKMAATRTWHCDHDVIQRLSTYDSRGLYCRHDVISGLTLHKFHTANGVLF